MGRWPALRDSVTSLVSFVAQWVPIPVFLNVRLPRKPCGLTTQSLLRFPYEIRWLRALYVARFTFLLFFHSKGSGAILWYILVQVFAVRGFCNGLSQRSTVTMNCPQTRAQNLCLEWDPNL